MSCSIYETFLHPFQCFFRHYVCTLCTLSKKTEEIKVASCGKLRQNKSMMDSINLKSVAGKLAATCFSASSNLGLIQISKYTCSGCEGERLMLDTLYFLFV